jgi:hypothetical protein
MTGKTVHTWHEISRSVIAAVIVATAGAALLMWRTESVFGDQIARQQKAIEALEIKQEHDHDNITEIGSDVKWIKKKLGG